jgi:peptidoglycan/LPS O-acetylase OafA/YrhL
VPNNRRPIERRAVPAPIAFLNTTKYPASLAFLLMTLGPMILFLPLADRARGRIGRVLVTFGRVPFFYYLLHIPVIHLLACVVSLARFGTVAPWLFGNHPTGAGPAPDGYMWSLALLYAVFVVAVAILYVPSRWFARVKSTGRYPWLRYL